MITFITWRWRSAYRESFTAEHVNVLAAMVRRHYRGAHRFLCLTDDPAGITCETAPIWSDHAAVPNPSAAKLPSCYRRLKVFDPATQRTLGIGPGDRFASLDLDLVLLDDVTDLFDRPEPFVGWAVRGTQHARVFNGSLFMSTGGYRPDVWTDFDPARSPQAARKAGYFGSDQGFLSLKLAATEAGWDLRDGISSYLRDHRLRGRSCPAGVRLVSFHGQKKPWHPFTLRESPWIRDHWRIDGDHREDLAGRRGRAA